MPQGLPKYLSATFVSVGRNGLAHALLGPAYVNTTTSTGTNVIIECSTAYPFEDTLTYKITASVDFQFHLRVPAWSAMKDTWYSLGNESHKPLHPDAHTGLHVLNLPKGTTALTYHLSSSIRTEQRPNSTISIYHGSLLYALDVGQTLTKSAPTLSSASTYADGPANNPPQVHDFTYVNTQPWNIGIDLSTLVYHDSRGNNTGSLNTTLPNPIWGYQAPPGYITAKGCEIAWDIYNGFPAPLQALPQGQSLRKCTTGKEIDVTLRPYGSLKVHMAVLGVVDLGGK